MSELNSDLIAQYIKKKYINNLDSDRDKVLNSNRLEYVANSSLGGELQWEIKKNHNQPEGHYKADTRNYRESINEHIVDEIVIHATGSWKNVTAKGYFQWMMYDVYHGRNGTVWVDQSKLEKYKKIPKIYHIRVKDGIFQGEIDDANAKRYEDYCKQVGLFHYLIPRKGNIIYEIIDPDENVCHSTAGRENDKSTIGLELLSDDLYNLGEYTESQYRLLYSLIFDYLIIRYPVINKISNHTWRIIEYCNNSERLKNCPGPKFKWASEDDKDVFENELRRRGFEFKKIKNKIDKLRLMSSKIESKKIYVHDQYEIDFWEKISQTKVYEEVKAWKSVKIEDLAKKWNVSFMNIILENRHMSKFLYKRRGFHYYMDKKSFIIYKPEV